MHGLPFFDEMDRGIFESWVNNVACNIGGFNNARLHVFFYRWVRTAEGEGEHENLGLTPAAPGCTGKCVLRNWMTSLQEGISD